ncbi:MarR family transcriptional regulator [Cronobacter sakazakii]|uniref:helix-turn-helix domain-containing GNAT family N-acetyltransferase n=1 Tax=Cronobacter sakazakii TaxID=28141 RepID=UPI001AE6CA4E|nr:helix-turn-helix domain-containing GNAT family N-acetyltransferase [Cronobacter sakazakii]EKK3978573.1 MarR family transcriptional regulator [Cronobacter sakazakii]EKM6343384.1 MarR family transcriptional regulator [Cronobacter sakazakii]EKM6351281.1 MarR family transcriptional regulator [Cronobacter sakazakii]EKM6367828.1 MarR family transcriptional regulator [Cronobacter sakazakii]EKM6378104.1 MarR family transcriptional regulator [Cronobacter sakazakii]
MTIEPQLVENIRVASRLMVRELGFMNQTLAATNYSPSVVHTLLEAERCGTITAAHLVQVLGLEKSSVSRMLAKLVAAGELQETGSADDARSKLLRLTAQGKTTVEKINHYGNERVIAALKKLSAPQRELVSQGLRHYAGALQACRHGVETGEKENLHIVTGYHPGMIGRITEMHGRYYAREHAFGAFFESKVAAGLADFARRLDNPCNQIWLAMLDGRIVGSVAIDGEDLGSGEAHLRWFILDDGCRGSGAGRTLMAEAMRFCDERQFPAVQLWTFNKLTAARRLYESFGFTLTKEWVGSQWGSMITEQQFTRKCPE